MTHLEVVAICAGSCFDQSRYVTSVPSCHINCPSPSRSSRPIHHVDIALWPTSTSSNHNPSYQNTTLWPISTTSNHNPSCQNTTLWPISTTSNHNPSCQNTALWPTSTSSNYNKICYENTCELSIIQSKSTLSRYHLVLWPLTYINTIPLWFIISK